MKMTIISVVPTDMEVSAGKFLNEVYCKNCALVNKNCTRYACNDGSNQTPVVHEEVIDGHRSGYNTGKSIYHKRKTCVLYPIQCRLTEFKCIKQCVFYTAENGSYTSERTAVLLNC